jgi:GT2 family glycosyltransferase
VFEHNARGLGECYNEVLDNCAGGDVIVVFAHDDVRVEDAFIQEKLDAGAGTFAIQGVAGATRMEAYESHEQTTWTLARAHLSGAVLQPHGSDQRAWTVFGPTPQRVVVLDGLLLAVDMRKIGNVRFDSQFTFDFYDLDFCLTAHEAGLTIGTTDIHVFHGSMGGVRNKVLQQRFRDKWRSKLPMEAMKP